MLIDDGSTDGTLEIARRAGADDPRIRVVARPHEGLVATLNAGIETCRADLVARMDADDLMRRRRLEEQLAMMRAEPELDAVGCHVRLFPRSRVGPGLRAYERWINAIDSPAAIRREAFIECPLAHPTLMIRRAVLAELGLPRPGLAGGLRTGAASAAGRAEAGGWFRAASCSGVTGPGVSRADSEMYGAEAFTRCKAAFLAASFLAGGPRYLLWGYGSTGRAIRRELVRLGKQPPRSSRCTQAVWATGSTARRSIPPEELIRVPRRPLLVSVAGQAPP